MLQSHSWLRGLLFGWLLLASFLPATASEVKWVDGSLASVDAMQTQFRATYESLGLPKGEKMGLMGATLLFDVNSHLRVGGGAYGALSGQRGGFITLGAAAELYQQIWQQFELNAGIFVGAGGGRGGFTLQGGGLMLRYHAGAQWNLGDLGGIGAGVSYVDFPDGVIHSFQPYISYSYPFSVLALPGWVDLPETQLRSRRRVHLAEQEFSVVYRRYNIPAGVLADNGATQYRTIGLAGVEWSRYLNNHIFVKVESAGAMQGKSNGYMQILFGAGYRQRITDSTWLKLSGAFGPAGGGNVATGGGVLLDVQLTLQQKLGEHLFAEAGVGYVRSPGASFKARSVSAMLGYHLFSPNADRTSVRMVDLGGFDAKHFRIRLVNQRYIQDAPNWRNHHANLNVDLLGFQADYFITDSLYLSGQGIGAYKGMAGGYMTGLVGGGVRLPVFGSPLFVEGDVLVGAAGGGGLDVAGGLVWQADASIGWQFSDAYSFQLSYGMMRAPRGNFKARVISLSLAYYLSIPTK